MSIAPRILRAILDRRYIIKQFAKTQRCILCNSTKNLTFHHHDPSKKIDTVARLSSSTSVIFLILEMEKCNIVCEKCHRKIHEHGLVCNHTPLTVPIVVRKQLFQTAQ